MLLLLSAAGSTAVAEKINFLEVFAAIIVSGGVVTAACWFYDRFVDLAAFASGGDTENMSFLLKLISHFNADFVFGVDVEQGMYDRVQKGFSSTLIAVDQF